MRSEREFTAAYREALRAIDPATSAFEADHVRLLGQTELCLTYLHRYLPEELIRVVPFLMMGYPRLLATPTEDATSALANVRHLCARFGSMSAWVDGMLTYARASEATRCFDIRDQRALLRGAAPRTLRALHEHWLTNSVAWTQRTLTRADPGDATVVAERGRTKLHYTIPAIPADDALVRKHVLTRRRTNPPIRIRQDQLLAVAEQIDQRERAPDWPSESLPPLDLHARLKKLQARAVKSAFYDGDTFTIDGATHVVGMLSSGKSTLVLAMLFALTIGGTGKRIAMLVGDTLQAAAVAARLRRHGVRATVLSSLRNRAKHVQAIQWHRSLDRSGWSLSFLGDVTEGFSTACPLDGSQSDTIVVEGAPGEWIYPDFSEKQCHRIYQRAPLDDDDVDHDPDDVGDSAKVRSCPLWTMCPAQEQQRSAIDAQVVIMTPQAFVHITPDKWTTENHLTIPELVQYSFDLVIIDEVDGVQKVLDDVFAPRSPIMGDERNVYAPSIGLRSSEALRQRSGVQFRKAVNTKWQSNFHTFFRLIGTIYAILQNEREFLRAFYENTPFTAGGILYDLWRRRNLATGMSPSDLTFENPTFEREFLEVVKVASAIRAYTRTSSLAQDDEADGAPSPAFEDRRFKAAADALQEIARQVLVADHYEAVLPVVEDAISGPLKVFNAVRSDGRKSDHLGPRANALALLLAAVTDLALGHYNWLIKTQSAVARDFDIDDGHLLGQTNSLLKHYRTLLPANPAGAAFGLFYDDPADDRRTAMGGKLTLISHLGVGRHLLTHLHDLLSAEGQAGPHVLMLSGTSWAGGSNRRRDSETGEPIDAASPLFDVQVPVKGVLIQPEAELEAIKHSVFALCYVRDDAARQIRVSGQTQKDRRTNLAIIAERFAARRDGLNRFEDDWRKMDLRWAKWTSAALQDRRRAMLVTNSYADAAAAADALAAALEANGYADWTVHCLARDRADDASLEEAKVSFAKSLPRSLVERFGLTPEKSVLVAPMQIVARGHNILNRGGKAAISSIYFLHRPHPRPDDLGPTISRLNRFAQERFDRGIKADNEESLAARARRMRYAANEIVRFGLEAGRFGYRSLPREFKAQFAWDMLTPLWQTIGRGIRGGSPVFVGFVDYAFAPLSFEDEGRADTADSSALVQSLRQLKQAMNPKSNRSEYEVARLLYKPFHDALAQTEGLRFG